MSPRDKGGPAKQVRTEKDERNLQSALQKVTKAGKDPDKTIGGGLRKAAQENA
jgi:hypothetical protein